MSSRHRGLSKDLCKNNNLCRLLGMAYVSEATRFLDDLLDRHPELKVLRQRNRATWWDHPQDPEVQQEREAARVAQGAYVYFPPAQSATKPDA